MSWHEEPVLGFDLETTGTDVERDRVVTAALVEVAPGGEVQQARGWLVDPGVPIPPAASAIHGVTDERARAEGQPAGAAVEEITAALAAAVGRGLPLVVMNARFDLTLLDRECERHGVPELTARLGGGPLRVLDPLILDKQVDRYRRGKRTLQALCAHYLVTLDGAHDSGVDALAAARVAQRICAANPRLTAMALDELHAWQMRAAAEQAVSFQQYLRRTSDPEARVEPAWPLVPRPLAPLV